MIDPVTWFIEPFALGFQQRALVGGILAGVMSAVIGTWLVLRGMSFFGDAFVHGIVPGIAAAVLLDINPTLGAAAAAVVMVAAIETVHRQTLLREDTAIGLLFVGMLALGVVIISKSASYAGSLTTILFGDVLGISASDLMIQGALAVVVIAAGVLLYRPLLVLALNRQKAEVLGLRPGLAHALLLVLIALAVIGSYQAVGTLLVFGLLVGPPAAAALVTRSIPAMMITAAAFAALSVIIGLQISYHLNTAGSATMALIPVLLFFVLLTGRGLIRRVRRHD
ncbi:MAG: zinc ABC transporter permease AztB [Actinomycetales bacterium]